MPQQADPPTSLVVWDRQSASSGGSLRVVQVLRRRIEMYHSYRHESTILVFAARVAERLL